jgi:hypothetical protein
MRFFVFRKKVEMPRPAQEERRLSAGMECLTADPYAKRKIQTLLSRCSALKCRQNRIVCGKTPAYPQQRMCRSRFFAGCSGFVQDRFSLDTMLFQRIRKHVNR